MKGQQKAAPLILGEVSDSEGSLPSIDSGASGKDSSDEE